MVMSKGKPIHSSVTKLRYTIGLYHDSKIQIYDDNYQTYGIYKFIALEGNWQIPLA